MQQHKSALNKYPETRSAIILCEQDDALPSSTLAAAGAPPTAAYSQPPQLPLPRGPNIPGGWPAASGLDRVPDHPSCCDAAAWAGMIDGAGPSVGWCACVPGVAVPSRGSLADSLRLLDPVSSMACPEGEAAKGCTGAGGAQGQEVTDQQACEPGLLGSCSCTHTCRALAGT